MLDEGLAIFFNPLARLALCLRFSRGEEIFKDAEAYDPPTETYAEIQPLARSVPALFAGSYG